MNLKISLIIICIAVLLTGCVSSSVTTPAKQEVVKPLLPKQEVVKRLSPFTNSLGMKFVHIVPGTFQMGDTGPTRDYKSPLHQVTISKSFYIMATEVTQKQWLELVEKNPSLFNDNDRLPVHEVSWYDTQVYIEKLNKIDKNTYRLPTEAEWEYACRAGKKPSLFRKSSFSGGFNKIVDPAPTVAGTYRANAWGLYDMHGNVPEWCQDWYGPYPSEPVLDPKGPVLGDYKIYRGGGGLSTINQSSSGYREYRKPNTTNGVGFRLVVDSNML